MILNTLPRSHGGYSGEKIAAHHCTVAATSTESGAGVTRRRYQLHGLDIDVITEDAAALRPVHVLFEHLGLVPGVSEAPASMAIHFSTRSGAVRLPSQAQVVAAQGGIQAWNLAGSLYLVCLGHACRLDVACGLGEWMLPLPPGRPRKDIITYGLLLLLRRRGLYALHASGVARDGAGLLFVAPSGSGKSTLTYSLARQGWEYLGDDALLLQAHGEEVEALSLRRDLCLDPSLAHAFPDVFERGEGGLFAGKGKRLLSMGALYPDRLVDRCVPRVLVFPEIVSHRTSRLVPLDPSEAFMRLTRQSAVVTLDPDAISAHLQVLGRLTRQARGYRLLAGQDLNGHPEAVATLLAGAHAPLARIRTG